MPNDWEISPGGAQGASGVHHGFLRAGAGEGLAVKTDQRRARRCPPLLTTEERGCSLRTKRFH